MLKRTFSRCSRHSPLGTAQRRARVRAGFAWDNARAISLRPTPRLFGYVACDAGERRCRGSWFALLPALAFSGVIVHRTVLEDQFLHVALGRLCRVQPQGSV